MIYRMLYFIRRLNPIKAKFKFPALLSKKQASQVIYDLLVSDKPCMITRFGSVELNCVINYLDVKSFNKNKISHSLLFIKKEVKFLKWNIDTLHTIYNNAGVFPQNNIAVLEEFSKTIINDLSQIDLLGCWLNDESRLLNSLNKAKFTNLENLEPYYHIKPWTKVLKNKKVLVIHPFAETIKIQYNKRKYLFDNIDVLPEFELITLKAIQSIAGEKTEFESWFSALEFMKSQVDRIDFDIAIIGCGAYGMPLAAHIKRIGKKAVHLGGATQILFGIKGVRWDNNPIVSGFYNEFWVRPSLSEIPLNSTKVEDGCYW